MNIIAEHLSYVYNAGSPFAAKALDDVSLTIGEGEFFGIIGHTGSGKSTFVKHLNGLIRLPSSQKHYKKPKAKKGQPAPVVPSLKVGEFDLADRKTDFYGLRKSVGMVFQYPEAQLFAETVFDDVAFGLKNFRKDMTDGEIAAAVRSAIEIVGLDYESVKDVSPFDLSGGQKRRAAIAGVIVTRPEVLILDEPAAGLDPLGKREIMELLHRLHGDWCKTVIIVSHDMDEIAENCTRAAVFSEGKLVCALPPKELFLKADELRSLGLDIPLAAKLCLALKERGIDLDCNFTVGDFVAAVLKKRGEKA